MNQINGNSPEKLIESALLDEPTVIALEGGPCGGKTTILNNLSDLALKNLVLIPESASEHIQILRQYGIDISDIAIKDRNLYINFQRDVLQTAYSRLVYSLTERRGTNSTIVLDRVDIGAYLNPEEAQQIYKSYGSKQPPWLREGLIEKIIYLPTIARSNPNAFEKLKHTNENRYEDASQARNRCLTNLGSVAVHPEIVYYHSDDFVEKVNMAIEAILNPGIETETKLMFTGKSPMEALNYLKALSNQILSSIKIFQSYHEINGQEFRLRKGKIEKNTYYQLTIKQGHGDKRQEKNRFITKNDFKALSQYKYLGSLTKTRNRLIVKLGGKEVLVSLDIYDQLNICQAEIEGFKKEDVTKELDWENFVIGGYEARELVK